MNSQAGSECSCGQSCNCGSSCRCGQVATLRSRRRRRSAEYGTLETIDEGSLNALRKEYKLGLKEITLSPDEDPAEALMRYNAASIREALERASQEPLEISGDQLSAGVEGDDEVQQEQEHSHLDQEQAHAQMGEQQEYGNGTMLPHQRVEQVEQQQQYLHAAPAANDTIVRELAAAREEFKQLYSLIQSLKQQLSRAEQSLNDCQYDATSTTSTTSTTTPATTTTPLPTVAPAVTSPRSNALQEEKSWERLLASKGYDTKYLVKPNGEQHQQQHSNRPESNLSGGDYSYQELQPYDPDNKAKRASGNGTTTSTSSSTSTSTTERSNAVAKLLNSLVPEEEAEAVPGSDDAAGAGADELATMSGSTPTPYALRGKFVRRGVRTTRQAIRSSIGSQVEPWRRNYSQEQVLLTKLDRLIDVLNDLLRLQLQRQRSSSNSSSSSSSMSSNSISSGRRILSTSKMPSKAIKRLRRRKQRRSSSTTEAPQKQRIHN